MAKIIGHVNLTITKGDYSSAERRERLEKAERAAQRQEKKYKKERKRTFRRINNSGTFFANLSIEDRHKVIEMSKAK